LFGVVAGLPGGAVVALATDPPWIRWAGHAVVLGAVLGLLFGEHQQSNGSAFSVGLLIGMLDWVTWTLTLAPVLEGDTLSWTIAVAVARFPELVGAALFGAVTGLVFHALSTWLPPRPALQRAKPHVVIVGGGGVSYGFLWWVLGNLTLLPVLLGEAPRWGAAALAESCPSLVGHLAYGAVLGLVYQRLEERVSPWHRSRSEAAAVRAAARHEQTLSAAPALWSLTACVALLIPILVS
jgi:hypothetical protein